MQQSIARFQVDLARIEKLEVRYRSHVRLAKGHLLLVSKTSARLEDHRLLATSPRHHSFDSDISGKFRNNTSII